MHRNRIGGYQGPVVVLNPAGDAVARAACRYRAELDGHGSDHWRGSLHRIVPAGAVTPGSYRLRFPEGQHGDVTIDAASANDDMMYFVGAGVRPLYPL